MSEELAAKLAAMKAATLSTVASTTEGDGGVSAPLPLEVKETPATTVVPPVEPEPPVKDEGLKENALEMASGFAYDEVQDLTYRTNAIQLEFGNFSDIPINSEYWSLMNRLRGLLRDKNA